MKFIIKTNTKIPGFGGIRGPILTPQEIPAKKVLDMVSKGCSVYEVMEDGSQRKVEFSDSRVFEQMLKEKQPTVKTDIIIKEEVKPIEDKKLFEDCRLLNENEIKEILSTPVDTEIKEEKDKSKKLNTEEISTKKFKKDDKKTDKKPSLPIDKVEKISDDNK